MYNGLTNEQIAEKCPAIFATSAYKDCSDSFGYVPTNDLLEGLYRIGLVVVTAMQSGSKIEGKEEYTKHLLRLRRRDDLASMKDDMHEIVIINAHDRTSSYKLMSGVFRMVCQNGMVVGDFDHEVRVKHTAHAVDRVVESTLTIVEEGRNVMEQVEAMKGIELDREEQLLLAKLAMSARFDLKMQDGEIVDEKMEKLPYTPADFLWSHRREDKKNDLWTTTNVIQERIIRGGVTRRDWEGKRKTTKEVKGIDQNIKLNQTLWQLAVGMQKIKQG